MDNDIYWLWLALKNGIGDKTAWMLIERFGTPRMIYEMDDLRAQSGLSSALVELLCDRSMDEAKRTSERVYDLGAYIITPEHDEYPALLRRMSYPPLVLYAKGHISLTMSDLTIGMVGTRTCNDYGIDAAWHIGSGLAQAGAVTVSGMADGIDTATAKASMECGGKTVAVLGSGLDVIYPRSNERLFGEIAERGAVFTEFPPGTQPHKGNFPRRNRIIAGLSYGVTVIQAPIKSGALITASQALDEGRDVFAVPGSIFDLHHAGTNKLIAEGAKAVMSAADILEEYEYLGCGRTAVSVRQVSVRTQRRDTAPRERKMTEERKNEILKELSGREADAVKLLFDGGAHIDEVSRALGITASETGALLLTLEIKGIVKRSDGDNYIVDDKI